MCQWVREAFDLTLELVSADGERLVSEDRDPLFCSTRRRRGMMKLFFQFDFERAATEVLVDGADFYPTKVELHATRKADGRKLCLAEAYAPALDDLPPDEAADTRLEIYAEVLPGWAEEPLALDVTLYREEGWTRPTRGRPRPRYYWWGSQGCIKGATEGWWENYSLIGNLFVALQSDVVFTDPRMSVCVAR